MDYINNKLIDWCINSDIDMDDTLLQDKIGDLSAKINEIYSKIEPEPKKQEQFIQFIVPLYCYEDTEPKLSCGNTYYRVQYTPTSFKILSDNALTLYAFHLSLARVDRKRVVDIIDTCYTLIKYNGKNVVWGDLAANYNIDEVAVDFLITSECKKVYYAIISVKAKDYALQAQDDINLTREDIQSYYSKDKNENENKKGKEETMANLFGDIKVGKAGRDYSLTYFGTIAFCGKSYYNGKIFDAQGMTINFDMLYLVPATEVKKGDIIDKSGTAYYVTDVTNGTIKAINLLDGIEETLIPGGPFGMQIYSKIFNPMGNMQGDNAFGNVLMMQALMGDGRSGDNGMLMAMMMMQGGFKFPTFEMPKLDAQAPTETKETK